MTTSMKRYFVTVGSRQVHYRRSGAGPAVVFLHGSPQSSAFVGPVMDAVVDRHTVIGLDTPGYGNSDPLAMAWPSAADYADAMARTLDALGIDVAAFYGTHTGAHIAMEFARRHPARSAALILDGISFNTPAERTELLARYAPPFVPSAAGEHLAWAWQHTRDQILFYPWFRAEAERRLAVDMADPSYTHNVVQAKMEAGDGYRVGYASAFSHDTFAAIADVTVPTAIMARPNDILTPQVKRIAANAPGNCRVAELSSDRDAMATAMQAFLLEVAACAAPPEPPAVNRMAAGATRRYADLPEGRQIHYRQAEGEGAGRPLVLLHDEMGSSALLVPLTARLAGSRPLIAIDLPGHGDSDAFEDAAPGVGRYRAGSSPRRSTAWASMASICMARAAVRSPPRRLPPPIPAGWRGWSSRNQRLLRLIGSPVSPSPTPPTSSPPPTAATYSPRGTAYATASCSGRGAGAKRMRCVPAIRTSRRTTCKRA